MPRIRSCPVCGNQHVKVLFRPKASPGPVSKCLRCGMVFVAVIEDDRALIFDGPVSHGQLDPRVLTSSNLDDVRGSWEFELLPDKAREWPALWQNATDALQRLERYVDSSGTGRRLLDLGSGWGFFLAVAKERGWTAYGVEPLPASAVYARATFGLNITTDTLRADTFPPNSFDVVTSFQVFEHLPDPRAEVQHLRAMLRKNGIVLIEVPNVENWTMRMMRAHHRHFVQDHLNFFSRDTLGRLLADGGLDVTDYYYPTRRMSIGHLVGHWFRRYLPVSAADALRGSVQRTGLWTRTIGLNVGDIVTLIARKRA